LKAGTFGYLPAYAKAAWGGSAIQGIESVMKVADTKK
jgi:hypothetical protein